MEDLLKKLWETYKDRLFSQSAIGRDFSLNHADQQTVIHQINELKNQPPKNGLRIKSVAHGTFKVIRSEPNESDSSKGKSLIGQNEVITGEMSEGFPEQSRENAQNHADSTDDPFPAVPAELKARPQWLVWKNETRDGKPTKIPYQPEGNKAQSNQSNTWTDYRTAASHRDCFSGIGFVFASSDPYCGIDLDNCLADDKVKAWAQEPVKRLKTVCYAEVSPSGNGIKFWTRATLRAEVKHKVYINESTGEAIEAYDQGRYFTVTGRGKGTIGEGQAVIDWLSAEYLSPEPLPQPRTSHAAPGSNLKSADEVISHIRESKQCHKFDALMAGNTTGYGSQSEADLALCGVIGFWTQEEGVIDSIFRTSKLMRPKWDERHKGDGATYGQMTITEALSGNRETYQPRRQIRRRSRRGRAAAAPGKRYR